MAKHYKGKKRGLRKGHKKNKAWRDALSASLKRAWKQGKFKGRKRRKGGRRKGSDRKRSMTHSKSTRTRRKRRGAPRHALHSYPYGGRNKRARRMKGE